MNMRQATEARVLNPHYDLDEHGLRQILEDVTEEVRRSVKKDIDGAEILHSLLNASWLQSLLKIYECLQWYLRNSPVPALDYASGLSLQLLIGIRSSPGCSEEAKELYCLLQQPHLQAFLSAHDMVAQKDYEPVLPPMPEDLPGDEEATRIICLVKNKQPLLCTNQRDRLLPPSASPPCAKSSSHWDTQRCVPPQRLHQGGAFVIQSPAAGSVDVKDSLWCSVRRGSYPLNEPLCHQSAARPCPPPHCKPISNCQVCCSKPLSECRVCYTNLLWKQSLNCSAPSVCSSVLIDNIMEEINSENEDEAGESSNTLSPRPTSQPWTMSPHCLTVPCYSNADDYLQPGLPPRLRNQSPCIRTAPPSPMRPHHVVEIPPVELAKQESLDELRTTVLLAASSMKNSTKDIKLLGEKMAAASERMTETVQDNSQALVLLTEVVERLQTVLATTRGNSNTPKPAVSERDGISKKIQTPKTRECPSLTHQSRCSFPSPSSSSSLSSFLDAPSTSQGTSCLSVSYRGSPQTSLKTKNAPWPQKEHVHTLQASKHPLTNGLLDEPKEASNTVKGRRSNNRKKKKRKMT
uniref:uncharacterized protein mpp4b isoform X3 n=1 Tax=Monopterus albus TaxID=43700 RepID=UPI0009B41818|nr:MAGUK p55 subfamily member 4 isoform X3 [Monopterus albus]